MSYIHLCISCAHAHECTDACMRIRVYLVCKYIYIYTYARIQTCEHGQQLFFSEYFAVVYVSTFACVRIYVVVYVFVRVYVCIHTCTCIYICIVHVYVYLLMHVHKYMYTYKYMYICTCTCI